MDINVLINILDAEAAQLAADAREGRPANASQADRLAFIVQGLRAAADGSPLNIAEIPDTLAGMTPLKAEAAYRAAERKGFVHPFQTLLKKRRMSLPEAAAKLGVMPAVAKGWTRKVQTRPIQKAIADKAEKLWDFKATARNWPNGIRQDD